ncbi:MAG TPA: PHP domain-containing protein, partial [Tepidisphaeraceae bacterium]|nr:PHP domain-containing protein [Tepidisphaeraceae bacterium]
MPEQSNPKLRETLGPPTAMPAEAECDYAELEVASNFSFLRGASHPDELVYRAAELGYRAIAITDVNSLAGVVRAHAAARQVKERGGRPPKLIIGARLCLEDAPELLVWAPDRAAYARLCRLLTLGKRRAAKGQCALGLADFVQYSEGLLAGIVCSEARRHGGTEARSVEEYELRVLREAMGDRLSLVSSCVYGNDDAGRLSQWMRLSRKSGVPLLATNGVHYHTPERRMLQDVLTCVRHGCTIHEAGFRLFPNGERYLKSPGQMQRLFADYPRAIRRGIEIAERCTFSLDELRYEYPNELVPARISAIAHLAQLAWQGAAERYPRGIPEKVRRLIEHELTLIEQLKYEAYFLTVYDLVKFARARGILCQGRGSAANSAVCYCIGITSVDPAR